MQKFRVSLILDLNKAKGTTPKEKENSKCPVYLRIYINGKRTLKATGYEIEPKYWDSDKEIVKSTQRIAGHINADLRLKKDELVKNLVTQQINGKEISVLSVKQSLQPDTTINIFKFVEVFMKDVVGKRSNGTMENYIKHLKKLEIFHGSQNLTFDEITPDYLTSYEIYLRKEVGNNYTHGLLKTLRVFFNAALKKGVITYYPFKDYEFPKYKSPLKDYLTIDELKRWEEYIPSCKNGVLYQTAIYFFFGCYCGLRISDWFKFSELSVEKDKIRLVATKNNANVSMPISKPLQRAIDLVLQTPLTEREAKINEKLKRIAKKLKINKHITAHTARHTFAVTICLSNKISSETAAELMGITLQTFVDNYSQVTDEKIRRETALAWSNLN